MSANKEQQKLIVVVEDDDMTRNLLATLLQEEGYRTVTVANGNEAIGTIQRLKPDLVTLDLSLPGKGGAEILAELQNIAMDADVAIVVVSAISAHLPPQLRALANSVLDKPFNLQELLNAVDKAMENGHKKVVTNEGM